MTNERFYELLGNIDGGSVQDAKREGRGTRPVWKHWGVAAACLCIALLAWVLMPSPSSDVVTEPACLNITTQAAASGEEWVMQKGVEIPVDLDWNPAMSSRPGLPLRLSDPGHPDAAFEISVEGGELLLWEENRVTRVESPFSAPNGTTVYWSSLSQKGENSFDASAGHRAYIDIVIREGEHLIGYAVVQIRIDGANDAQPYTYSATLLQSVYYPKVNGDYQGITLEYIASEMEQVKSKTAEEGAG